MQIESHTLGFNFFRRMLDGISKRIYGTKKMTRAVLYLLPSVIFSSSDRPKTFALEMLTLRVVVSPKSAVTAKSDIPVQEGKQVHDAQKRDDMEVDLVQQLALGRVCRALHLRLGECLIVVVRRSVCLCCLGQRGAIQAEMLKGLTLVITHGVPKARSRLPEVKSRLSRSGRKREVCEAL